ncbi:MAG: integral rane sensor signal transduction histidine kinase, partial [Alphaproteobacteria bacterium]|nr:integral rane sensor signal transduction histidine kinase [Alphaproteobacteria bacterium]
TFLLQIVSSSAVLVTVWRVAANQVVRASSTLTEELRDDLLADYRETGLAGLDELVRDRLRESNDPDIVLLLTDGRGRVLAGNLAAWPPPARTEGQWDRMLLFRVNHEDPEAIGFIATPLRGGARLFTGHVIEDEVRLEGILTQTTIAAMALAALLSLAAAIVLARLIAARVSTLAATAEAVSGGALSRRVPDRGSGDAFDGLANAINSMLDRIEALVLELRVVTDGLAHDIRSPLARLQGYLETTSAEVAGASNVEALEKAKGEVAGLLKMVGMALEISRAEAGIGRERLQPTEIVPLLADLCELYAPEAEERGFTLHVEGPAGLSAWIHRELLSQTIGNLIENALKYASPGPLLLAARAVGSELCIIVTDRGSGIEAKDRPLAVKRFGRLDPARTAGGSGLGLSLAAAIAHLHRGRLELEDAEPGLRVLLWLPLEKAPGSGATAFGGNHP